VRRYAAASLVVCRLERDSEWHRIGWGYSRLPDNNFDDSRFWILLGASLSRSRHSWTRCTPGALATFGIITPNTEIVLSVCPRMVMLDGLDWLAG